MTKHNLQADGVEDCDACLEIVTDPQFPSNFAGELQAFAQADRQHFATE